MRLKYIFEDAVNSGNIEKAANLQALLQKQVRGASSDLSIARYNAKEYDKSLDAIGRVKLGNYLQKWLDTNTAATKEARMEVKGYINDLQNGLITTQSQEKTIRTRIGTIENAQRAMGRLGSSPLVALKAGMSKFTSWISASGAVMQAINEVRNGINTIKELDDGLTNINYTMEVSSKQLKDIGNALSTDYIPWLNEYNYEFRDQMAGFDETEWGRGYDYNYDHAEGFEKFWEKFYDAGIISKDYEGIMQMRTENQRNYKVKSDPNSIQYAPQTTKYGGTLKPDMYGKNDDAILAEYVTDKMSPQEILDTMIEKRNSHGGYLSEGDYAIAANAETVLNRQRFKNGQFDQQTSQWNGLLFDLDNADFTQSNQALMDFCTENGGVTAQEAEYFNTYKEYQDKYNSYAELLLSVGVDVSEQLSRLNENIRESFKEALSVRTISPTNLDHFASGTKSAKGGLAITDEDGYEAKLREIQAGRYTLLKEDDMIFSKADTNKLWELVKNPSTFLSDQMKNITTPTLPQVNNVQNNNDNSMAVHNHFNGDIVMTESISNGSEFITDLGIQLNSRFDVTKNMKR